MKSTEGNAFLQDKFAGLLKTRRILGGQDWKPMSYRQAAKAVGVSHTTFQRLELKKMKPDVETLYKCCQWLKIDMNELFESK